MSRMSDGGSQYEYDDRVSLHADYDSELAGNLKNILGTNKESEDEDSDTGLKSLIQELDKDEKLGEKINKDLADIANKVNKIKNNKDISIKELRLQLSNVIKICTESLTFLGMANLEGDNIRRQYLSKVLPPKLTPLTKDVPTPSEFLLGNNLNDRIGIIETSQKMLQTYSNSPYYKNSKNLPRFPKNPGNQNKGYSSSSQTRGYNNHQKQRQGYQRLQYHKRN